MTFQEVNEAIGKDARIFAPDGIPPKKVDFVQVENGFTANGWHCKKYQDQLGEKWSFRRAGRQKRGELAP